MRTRLLVAVSIAAASAAAALFAQSTTSDKQEQPRPTFRAEANYVRVDMYPTQNERPIDDLTQQEIEILEDGVPQNIATFEHVKVRPPGDQASRIEPNTVEQSRQATADPRARVFVIFLDTPHITFEGAHMTRRPIVQFLDRVIGQDDLVAVMTPEMAAAEITFGRKTTVISKMLDDTWLWGRRDTRIVQDPRERSYDVCFPDVPPLTSRSPDTEGIAHEMVQRRREKLTFDALEDLIRHLGGVREERKAVLTISEGWRLFGVNRTLAARPKNTDAPTGDPIYVGPDGKLRRGRDPRETSDAASQAQCEAERNALAAWDGRREFYAMFDRANRGNVSFYTIYARGLAVSDEHIDTGRRRTIDERGSRIGNHDTPTNDHQVLRSRLDSLRALSQNTDGLAVQDTNAIESAMQRIVSDLTSYYLVGYYSSNPKIDGKFREISVRVKRPGVKVRARRGYRAPTVEQLTEAAAAEKAKPAAAVTRAFDTVAAVSPRSQLRIRAASWHGTAAAEPAAAVWIVGEVDYRVRKELAWSAGAAAEVLVVSAAGVDVASKTIELPAGVGTFALRVPEAGGVPPGEYAVRVKVKPKQDDSLPVADSARVIVPAEAARVGEALLWRRGPTTGPKFAATADPRFQRSERVRVEHPTTAAGTATGRLLDRAGQPLNIPVQVTDRQDSSGEFRWLVAEAALAPLAPGDYAIEVTLDDQKALTGFKVVP
jgi:VWFA-related protein